VQVGARAAFRHRDTMVIVDVSKQNETNLPLVRDALSQFVDTSNGFHIPGDRMSMMAYAGQTWIYDLTDTDQGTVDSANLMGGGYVGAEPTFPFYTLKDHADTAHDVMQLVETCNVGPEAWFHWYRHMTGTAEAEITAYYSQNNAASFEYWVVGPQDPNSTSPTDMDLFRLDPSVQSNAFMLYYMDMWATAALPTCALQNQNGELCTYFSDRAMTHLSKQDQCWAWLASESVFTAFDPRHAQVVASGKRSPLECHAGHFFEAHPGEYDGVRPLLSVFCDFAGDEGVDGTPRYGRAGEDGQSLYPKPEYTLAGSWPGRALDRALHAFQDRSLKSGEANIVLVTASPPNCGPLIGDTWGPTCDTQVRQELYDSIAAIQAAGNVNLYVVVVGDDADAIATFSALTADGIGRGWYATVAPDQLGNELGDIARDMKIQVVQ
jgi:hypothetical protein